MILSRIFFLNIGELISLGYKLEGISLDDSLDKLIPAKPAILLNEFELSIFS